MVTSSPGVTFTIKIEQAKCKDGTYLANLAAPSFVAQTPVAGSTAYLADDGTSLVNTIDDYVEGKTRFTYT